MAISEFELIDRFFRDCGGKRADVKLGIGDDAALLESPAGMQLVAAIDTLVAGVHFPNESSAASIGHRALAVNLSDLAAMGARPAWALLALTLPSAQEAWLAEFARALADLAIEHDVALVGGDTTRGPLSVTLQVLGHVPATGALRRGGACSGDALFVSGSPGDAAAGLALEQGRLTAVDAAAARYLRERFQFPVPRVALGLRLRTLASACIDVSDGLLADAAKLARASGCGVQLQLEDLPVSQALEQVAGAAQARALALNGGDDYELCFSVPPARLARLHTELPPARWPYHRIGTLTSGSEVRVHSNGAPIEVSSKGYEHFAR